MTPASADVLAVPSPCNGEREDGASGEPIEVGKTAGGRRAWSAKRAALTTTGTNVVISVLGMCTGVMAARLFGPKGRGELAAIQAWPNALGSLGLLGTAEALVYFCVREREQRGSYMSASLLIASAGALICSFAGFVAMPWLLKAQSPSVIWGARIFLLQIWLYLVLAMPTEVLRAAGRFFAWNAIRVCPIVLWTAVLVAAWFEGSSNPVLIACASVMLSWIILPAVAVLVHSEVPKLALPSRAQLAQILRFGVPAMCAFVPQIMNLKLDQILMAGLMPPMVLGQYVVGVAWSNAGMPFVHGLALVVVPDLAGRADAASQGEALARVSRMAILMGALIALGLLASAPLGIPFFFGARFRPAVRAAEILTLAGVVAGFNLVLSEGMRGLGRPVAALRAELLALAVTAGGLWLFLRPFGILGAAIVSLAAYSCTALWLIAEARAATGVSMMDLAVPRWPDFRLLVDNLCETVKASTGQIRAIRTHEMERAASAAEKY
ncbi:MAG: polysaccharide biosynthesis C-terminal domain-containing protein [Deltaproteobacteria bacterium]|nr:polysaccharide biosynthesis C-terminal domain-containing protein [Deltaproteobacteria bacterium]